MHRKHIEQNGVFKVLASVVNFFSSLKLTAVSKHWRLQQLLVSVDNLESGHWSGCMCVCVGMCVCSVSSSAESLTALSWLCSVCCLCYNDLNNDEFTRLVSFSYCWPGLETGQRFQLGQVIVSVRPDSCQSYQILKVFVFWSIHRWVGLDHGSKRVRSGQVRSWVTTLECVRLYKQNMIHIFTTLVTLFAKRVEVRHY